MSQKKLFSMCGIVLTIFFATGCGSVNKNVSNGIMLSDLDGHVALAATTISANPIDSVDLFSNLPMNPQVSTPISSPISGESPIILTTEDKKISEFSTSFKGGTKARKENIKKASLAVDQTLVLPGEIFSFNNTVGPTTKKNGFLLGKIFIRGKEYKGYGGGVCQVSSTLYNAALAANLQIIERHPHTKEVKYVPKDKDAATSYGSIDFKFANNYPYPVKINSYLMNDSIYTAIEMA